jgi:hypothetical protein
LDQLKQAKNEVNGVVSAIIADSYDKLSPDGRKRLGELSH